MEGLPHVTVKDTTVALGQIARSSRDGFSGPVIGITGSVGKTTAKELLALALSPKFSVHKTPENHNNEIGLPQTILSAPPETTALVLEMGMRGLGQIADLSRIAAPTAGVVTGIGVTHIELLETRENIATAKGELLESLTADGLSVFPATDDFAEALRAKSKGTILTVALDGPADLSATNLRAEGAGWRADVSTPWGALDLFVPSPGRFNVQNALLALAVAGSLGVPLAEDAGKAIASYAPTKMRLEVLQTPNGATVLSDCYNAAPDSMAGALETLMQTELLARAAPESRCSARCASWVPTPTKAMRSSGGQWGVSSRKCSSWSARNRPARSARRRSPRDSHSTTSTTSRTRRKPPRR